MGKINIYSTNGTNKASLDYTGTSDITVDAEHLAGTTSNVQTQLDNKLSLTGGTLATDTITNASGNLTIASTQSILLKFDSDNDQTNREFNLQNNTGDQILKVKETGTAIFSGDVGIGTTNPRATLDTGYTRVYNSGAASSPTDGKGLEIHYVTSGRTQGEGAYVISYDRDNSAYKQFTIDADSINLSTGGTTRLSVTNVGVIQGTSDAEIATSPIRTHSNTISTSTTIDANDNAVASGPLAIADGVTLTINGNMTVV